MGIVAETSDLEASDAEVGASGTTYATVSSRGVLDGGDDSLTLSEDGLTLTFNSVNANDGSLDQTRVITEAVPFNNQTGVVGTAFVGLCFSWQLRKRQRHSKVETE